MIAIQDMYRQNFKIDNHGIEGYHVAQKYESLGKAKPLVGADKKKPHATKRGSFLDDQIKAHERVPGPGSYMAMRDTWAFKQKSTSKVKTPNRMTYIDEIMNKEKRNHTPAPGQYTASSASVPSLKRKHVKEQKQTDRMTYLDGVQFNANNTPGVGSYNPVSRPLTALVSSRKKMQPAEWIIKHEKESKKKKQKQPDMGTYDPKNITERKEFAKISKDYCKWGKFDRFKVDKSQADIGPGKYNADESRVSSRRATKSVYYQ